MSQQQVQQKADQAKQKSQAFSKTIYNTSFEVVDAATAVLYYVLGASYGVFLGALSFFNDPKLNKEAKETVNGVKEDLRDGAYDIKARVANSVGPAVDDAKSRASGASRQAQGFASDVSKQGQAKAGDLKKQAVSQGQQAQGQFKQTAQANGIKA